MKIPIIIITFLCPDLRSSLRSLYESLKGGEVDYCVVLVNNSAFISDEYKKYLYSIMNEFSFISHIFSSKNKWVLSLNSPEVQDIISQSEFYVIADDDIVYPAPNLGVTWLDYLLLCFTYHPKASKIGLHILPNSDSVYNTLDYQLGHNLKGKILFDKFLDLYQIPVDTTPALYRVDSFVPGNNKFSPRHNQLLFPDRLNLRTSRFGCTSVSNDPSFFDLNPSIKRTRIISKALCFANVSARLSIDNQKQTPFAALMYYKIVRPLSWLYWTFDALIRRSRVSIKFSYLLKRQ